MEMIPVRKCEDLKKISQPDGNSQDKIPNLEKILTTSGISKTKKWAI
jgi:hypothetical protein